jgi:polyphosphate kinase
LKFRPVDASFYDLFSESAAHLVVGAQLLAEMLGSADMMHRNLDRRVEALVRIADPGHVVELADLIDHAFPDTTSLWDLRSDGRWVRHHQSDSGEPLDDLQGRLIERHDKRRRKARRR